MPASVVRFPAPGKPGSTAPAPVAVLGHYFFFPSLGVGRCRLHQPAGVAAEATLTPDALVLRFRAGPDYLRFELSRDQLPAPAAWPATYQLRSPARPLNPARVQYQYGRFGQRGAAPCLLPLSELATQLTGSLTLTAHDLDQLLLSGHFEVRAPGQPDPTGTTAPDALCTILLAGDFTDLRLQLA